LPEVKVCSALRALSSCTGTFLKSASRYALASASDLPCFNCAPQPAITFHRAPPDVNGFGVMTSTPGLVRSDQVLMCLGLPLRVTNSTTESVIIPFSGPLFQSAATRLAFTNRVTSGSSAKATTSAVRPDSTARLWSPEAPNDLVNV